MPGVDSRETASSHGSSSHPSVSGADHVHLGAGLLDAPPLGGPPRQPPTSAEIDAVIAAAIANAPPPPPPMDLGLESSTRSLTPLMTNILPSAIGSDGRVNLFVGNLPYRVRWQDLKDLFRKAGTVLRADVSLGPDNRSRGYGNVLMGSREDAARAIDRFNGFTWQTRTLEVRPDRLPPEYEPQPHIHHKPMFGGFMGPPMHHFGGGGGGGGGGWHGRPPHHGMPFGGFGHHVGPGGAHGPPHQSFVRPPPALAGHVPAVPPIGASPLAGSLTAGPNATAAAAAAGSSGVGTAWAPGGKPGGFGVTPVADNTRTGSPGTLGTLPQLGVESKLSASPSRGLEMGEPLPGRGPLAGRLGSSLLSKPAISADSLESSPGLGRGSETSSEAATPPVLVPPPIPLNGLANQAKDLGAPSTLYDRVVFVKHLSPTTQWQDLKDLFRPAGVVIRADVATTPDGQSRGFGTVLFASKEDALRAVSMFNNCEVDGRILHVQTERRTLEDKQIQPIHPVETFSGFSAKPPPPWSQSTPPLATTRPPASNPFPQGPVAGATSGSSNSTRVPWQLDTVLSGGTSGAPVRSSEPPAVKPNPKHPGPITLPPFPTLGEINPMSPMQTRNAPPMTPSMPGFVFNAYPRTPPVHPQHPFLSPGAVGPFSPGAPVTSPVYSGRSPLLNAAPGAPVYRQPPQGSAALGTPTTQPYPNKSRPAAGPPGGEVADYFPPVEEVKKEEKEDESLANATAGLSVRDAAIPTAPPPEVTITAGSPPINGGRNSTDGGGEAKLTGAWNSERRASWSEVAGSQAS